MDHQGDIAGDARASSANPDDIVTVAPESAVGGTTDLQLGLVVPPKHGHGRGRSDTGAITATGIAHDQEVEY